MTGHIASRKTENVSQLFLPLKVCFMGRHHFHDLGACYTSRFSGPTSVGPPRPSKETWMIASPSGGLHAHLSWRNCDLSYTSSRTQGLLVISL